jgi:GNAT superfamily N-acetyltransferase
MRIRVMPGRGDATKGGYNGTLIAEHDGCPVGSIEYQTATGQPGFKIAMLKVLPEYQGRGIGSGLLKAAMREAPGPVDPGWTTDQGWQFWEQRGREIAEHYKPPEWTPELPEFETEEPRPGREIPEPEFDVELGA